MRHRLFAGMLALLLLVAQIAQAAVTATPVFVQTPKLGRTQLVAATLYAINAGGTAVTNTVAVYTCGANGSKITGIVAATNESAARDVTLFIVPASNVPYILTTVNVPIGAGTLNGTPPVNLLSPSNTPGLPTDSDGNAYLQCESGDVIRAGSKTTMTASTITTFLAIGGDF